MTTRILVTPRSMTSTALDAVPELAPLRERGWELVSGPPGRTPSTSELMELLPGIDGWICGIETVSAEALAAADRLRVIARNGVGADAVDVVAAEARGIRVVLARGANSRGVAELTLALMLSALRDIPASDRILHDGGWDRHLGRELADCVVGVVGFGAIGRLVAQFATALGARVLAADPFATIDSPGVEAAGLEELFATCDVVTLHSPPPLDGSPLIGAAALAMMPRGTVLVNTARSALIDPPAVLEALATGHLSAYAVDAFDQEPPLLDGVLSHPRTIMTPHLGGFTAASVRRATSQAVANVVEALSGER
ncbi:phosphoglycerate dehydrogenase [Microbacterium trichothecenolyticum]|uniref:phosphoglycerate dehydrogenase n=1 Tax=Microbacterium trichothecenolyticum TaxID=69370 RepID=UPI001C6F0E9D|nr:phosphoglycerate dehydrogenase [Microbacterium trichothecenolyticum]MBW9122425.1 phosphoglycerate dehydrogenase [Microbacterium trichothecenolyticum]